MPNKIVKNTNKRKNHIGSDDIFIKDNFKKMESSEIAKVLGRQRHEIEHRIVLLRSKGYIGLKNHRSNAAGDAILESMGRKNKDYIAAIRKQIKLNKYINLQIGNENEKVDVVFKSFIYFTVQHRNYKESYSYTDILLGNIKVKM